MNKEAVKLYPLTPFQEMVISQMKFSLHGGVSQIPVLIKINQKVDFEIMKKAINIEIERNDAARLKFVKKGKKVFQYFDEPFTIKKVPFSNLKEKTKKEQDKITEKFSRSHMKYLKDEIIRFHFLETYDNKYAVLAAGHHLAFDATGMFIMIKDLLNIYFALKGEKEFPKPLSKYEDCLEHDYRVYNEPGLEEKNLQFFLDMLSESTPVDRFSEPVDKSLPLPPLKKGKENNIGYNAIHTLFHDKTEQHISHISREKTVKYKEFCEENNFSLTNLFTFAVMVYLARVNKSNDVLIGTIMNRRATLKDKNSSGSRASGQDMRVIYDGKETCIDALNKCKYVQVKMFRHCDLYISSPIIEETFNLFLLNHYGATYLSFIPADVEIVKGYEIEAIPLSCGRSIIPLYIYIIPSMLDGGLDLYFEYMLRFLNKIQAKAFNEGIIKIIDKLLNNPTMSFDELKNYY